MPAKVAFVFSQFPCYDEVFILREMAALKERLDLTIYSIKRNRRDPVRHQISLPLLERVVYSPLFFSRPLWAANLRVLTRHPLRYLAALGEIIRLHWPSPEMLLKSLAIFPQAVYFARLCRLKGIDRVHGQWATYPAAAALVISRLNRSGFSFTGHAHDIYLKMAALKGKLRRADFVITCTAANRDHLLSLAPDIDPGKIKVVYHGVDLDHYPFRGERRRPRGGQFRILSVGSLFECKGYETLLSACRLLQARDFDFRCRIVGGGHLESRLKKLVDEWGLSPRVEFTGYQRQEDMPEHYRWADLLVLAAVGKIHWGIPNVLLEALATGVPVACTHLPSLPELLGEPSCGFSFPEGRPDLIAELIVKLSRQDDLLVAHGKAGRKKVEEKWDIRINSLKIAELFQKTVKAGGKDD